MSESFFASSRGNLANYVLPFQMPKPPKKVLKGENAGDTPYVIFASPLMCYLPVPISNGQGNTPANQNRLAFNLCSYQPIRNLPDLSCDICQSAKWVWAIKPTPHQPIRTGWHLTSAVWQISHGAGKYDMKFTVAGTFFLGTGKYYTSSIYFCSCP